MSSTTPTPTAEETHLVPILGTYLALFTYPLPNQPEDPGCLPIQKGDLVHVLEKHASGWWEAFVRGKRGWVPSNYLTPQPTATPVASAPAPDPVPGTDAAAEKKNSKDLTTGLEKLEQRLTTPSSPEPQRTSSPAFLRSSSTVSDFQKELACPLLDSTLRATTAANGASTSSLEPLTWDALTQGILDPMTQVNLVSKKVPPDPIALVHHLNMIINRVRFMLNSCHASKEAQTDKQLKTNYQALLNALAKFTLAGQIASGGWPPPDAIQNLRLRASHLLLHLRAFLSHAKFLSLHPIENDTTQAFDIGVVEVETYAQFHQHLRTLETTLQAIPSAESTSSETTDFTSWMPSLTLLVQHFGHLISLVDDLPCLQDFAVPSEAAKKCLQQRDLLYTQTNDVVTAARTLLDSFRPPNAVVLVHKALQASWATAQALVHCAKLAMETERKPDALVKVLEASKKRELEMSVLQRRALSLSFDSLSTKLSDSEPPARPLSSLSSGTSNRNKSREPILSEVAPLESFFQTGAPSESALARAQPSLPELPARVDFLGRDATVHDLLFTKEGKVLAGTLPALVEQLTTHEAPVDRMYLSAFFRTFRMFTTPLEVCQQLIQRFQMPLPGHLNDLDTEVWKEKKLTPVRLRVFNALKLWLDQFYHAPTDQSMLDTLVLFAQRVLSQAMPQAGKRLLELIEKCRKESSLATKPVPMSYPTLSAASSVSINWNSETDMQTLTEQVTLIEYDMYKGITALDLVHWISARDISHSPVRTMVHFSTQFSSFVCSSILNEQDVKKRSHVLKFWIKVAEKCLAIQNFNTLRAVLGAIDSSTISRLSKTWDLLSDKVLAILPQLHETIDPSRNSAVYREKLKNTLPPCIPFLGLCLTDLTFIQEGTKNLRENLINFDKYSKISQCISELLRFQSPYSYTLQADWAQWIRSKITMGPNSPYMDQEQLYRMSLVVEPKVSQTYAT